VDDNEATWGSDRHGVKAIIDHGLVTQARGRAPQLQYRVRWEGESLAETWEPDEYLDSCPEALLEYWHQVSASHAVNGSAIKGGGTKVVRGRLRQAELARNSNHRIAYCAEQDYKLPPLCEPLLECPDKALLYSDKAVNTRIMQVWSYDKGTDTEYTQWCEGIISKFIDQSDAASTSSRARNKRGPLRSSCFSVIWERGQSKS